MIEIADVKGSYKLDYAGVLSLRAAQLFGEQANVAVSMRLPQLAGALAAKSARSAFFAVPELAG